MATGLSKLTAQLSGSSTPGTRPRAWVEAGVIKAVAAGYVAPEYVDDTPPSTVTCTWRGTDVPVSYLDSYTPVVDDVVLLLVQPPSLIVLGKLLGPNLEDDE